MVLREAGLAENRREGWNIFYCVIKPAVDDVMDAARKVVGEEHIQIPFRLVERACTFQK